ncbi:hypothetical protein AKJ16_DCAP07891 [Drosera capensis]
MVHELEESSVRSMFKPSGIFWACLISLSLFGSSLQAIGYYTVIWGSTIEGKARNHLRYERFGSSGLTVPLIEETDQIVDKDLNP